MTARTGAIRLLLAGGLGLGGMLFIGPAPGPLVALYAWSARAAGIHKIQHVVIIMQENRSFDSYFGTYPGADGIPMRQDVPIVCILDPKTKHCVKPFRDRQDRNYGGPHGAMNATGDIDQGTMDGFIREEEQGHRQACKEAFNPSCSATDEPPDVMGYHDRHDIPNYWAYARNFVLQDHMFEAAASWSLPVHLFMVSAWSAKCTRPGDPMSCHNDLLSAALPPDFGFRRGLVRRPDYAWTDLTYLLHKYHLSWAYYVANGTQPDCRDDAMFCRAMLQRAGTPGIWNPLPYFDTVHADGQLDNIRPLSRFYAAVQTGRLPEDDFLDGQRLDPRTDGRPDPRPDVREDQPILGNLASDFDFSQAPRPPLVLPTHPATDLVAPSRTTPGPGRVRHHHGHTPEVR